MQQRLVEENAPLGGKRPIFLAKDPPIAHCPLTLGNVGGSPTPGNHTAETGLAGWGARIRTWEWRNQNPPCCLPFNVHSEKSTKFDPFQSIGWMLIQNAPPLRKPCGAPFIREREKSSDRQLARRPTRPRQWPIRSRRLRPKRRKQYPTKFVDPALRWADTRLWVRTGS